MLLHGNAKVREDKSLPQGVSPQLLHGRVASGGSWQGPRVISPNPNGAADRGAVKLSDKKHNAE